MPIYYDHTTYPADGAAGDPLPLRQELDLIDAGFVLVAADIAALSSVEIAFHAATSKTTPVDADEIPLVDSAALNGLKKLTWANLKTTLASIFAPIAHVGSGGTEHANSIAAGAAGFMTGSDKTKLDAISGTNTGNQTPGADNIGYLNIPQNSQSAAYTLVIADAGRQIFHPAADTTARIFTIPANASVAYPVGTAITFINQNGTGGIITIAITTDTMRLAGAGTTGSRTLARNGIATAIKVTATEWIISGTGLT